METAVIHTSEPETPEPPDPSEYEKTLADYELDAVEFIWEGFMPIGSLIYVHSEEGFGKTSLVLRIMADISKGSLPGKFHEQPQNVAIICPEDDIETSILPKFMFADGDISKFQTLDEWWDATQYKKVPITLKTTREQEYVEGRINRQQIKFLLVDSRFAALNIKDSKSDQDIYGALTPIQSMAKRTGATICVLGHDNKGKHATSRDSSNGSQAYYGVARAVYHMVNTEVVSGVTKGVFGLTKSNSFNNQVPGKLYELRGHSYTVPHILDKETGKPKEQSVGVASLNGETDVAGKKFIQEFLLGRIRKEREDKQISSKDVGGRPSVKEWVLHKLMEAGDIGIISKVLVELGEKEWNYTQSNIVREAKNLGKHERECTQEQLNEISFTTGRKPVVWYLPQDMREVHIKNGWTPKPEFASEGTLLGF